MPTNSPFVFPAVPENPLRFWRTLHPQPRYGFFLGSGAATDLDHLIYMSAGEPSRIFLSSKTNPDPLKSIEAALHKKGSSRVFDLFPRFVGFLGFDYGHLCDPAIAHFPQRPDPTHTPLGLFGDYPDMVKIDLKKRETTLAVSSNVDQLNTLIRRIREYFQNEARPPSADKREAHQDRRLHVPPLSVFSSMVRRAKEHISAGDIYQANLSLRFEGPFNGDPVAYYQRLCRVNPSPYACLLKFGSRWVASCSPELLLRVTGRRAVTRPIAGTRPRGKTKVSDRRRRGQLLLSPKERAEHIMLVDLERNDLGRVCRPGSVRVTEQTVVERYSHVMHIVSQVEGTLAGRKTAVDALRALFPGGTITGCPKIRSIEIIQNLEGVSRGPFYGSAGFFTSGGDATFNILIRTALISPSRIVIQAGAGIVADSQAKKEYCETMAKARVLLEKDL